jgi:hypothetical protein
MGRYERTIPRVGATGVRIRYQRIRQVVLCHSPCFIPERGGAPLVSGRLVLYHTTVPVTKANSHSVESACISSLEKSNDLFFMRRSKTPLMQGE